VIVNPKSSFFRTADIVGINGHFVNEEGTVFTKFEVFNPSRLQKNSEKTLKTRNSNSSVNEKRKLIDFLLTISDF
jgi:hypothetical protein